jgi:hypothetical protein
MIPIPRCSLIPMHKVIRGIPRDVLTRVPEAIGREPHSESSHIERTP